MKAPQIQGYQGGERETWLGEYLPAQGNPKGTPEKEHCSEYLTLIFPVLNYSLELPSMPSPHPFPVTAAHDCCVRLTSLPLETEFVHTKIKFFAFYTNAKSHQITLVIRNNSSFLIHNFLDAGVHPMTMEGRCLEVFFTFKLFSHPLVLLLLFLSHSLML